MKLVCFFSKIKFLNTIGWKSSLFIEKAGVFDAGWHWDHCSEVYWASEPEISKSSATNDEIFIFKQQQKQKGLSCCLNSFEFVKKAYLSWLVDFVVEMMSIVRTLFISSLMQHMIQLSSNQIIESENT